MSGGTPQEGRPAAAGRSLLGRAGHLLGQGSRLPSLRTPRDLTLGGAAKRTFAPTIPARREKGKEQPVNADGSGSSNSSDRRGRGDRGGRGGRGGRGVDRGRGGRGRGVIQLQSSVFADGPAERMMRARRGGGGGGGSAGGGVDNYIQKPKVSFDFSAGSADPEEEKKHLQELFKDDFIDDGDDVGEVCEANRPVVLPLRPVTVKTETDIKMINDSSGLKMDKSTSEEKEKIKNEPTSDTEMESVDAIAAFINDTEELKVKDEKDEKKGSITLSCKDIFTKASRSSREEIFLFQLPDILPGLPKSKDEKKPKIKQEPGTGFGHGEASTSHASEIKSETTAQIGKEKGIKLEDVSEGHIGKIQFMKSGKTRLLMGNATFDLELGTPVGFLQDLVCLKIGDEESYGGSLSVLGHVKHKVVCVPDMEAMLSNRK